MFAQRVDNALRRALQDITSPPGPPRLMEAVRYAVFPGGGRIRPRLCLAVAEASGGDNPELAEAAAAAIELLHSASLVHDDMPCFDDAPTRRGKPSVHKRFNEELALLTGDALIVLAYENLARASTRNPERLASLILSISRGVGVPHGIVAGQGWESEETLDLEHYHRAKTGALFVAAVSAGALAAGADPAPWRPLGMALGEAYQIADDILDTLGSEEKIGKPVGQDRAQDRPNAVAAFGVDGAFKRLEACLDAASERVPPCAASDILEHWLSKLVEKHFRPRIQAHLDQRRRAQG